MASGQAIAGALQGFMGGYDYQNRLNAEQARQDEARQAREAERQRQHKIFQQEQQDRQHMLERRPVLEQRQDEQYGLQNKLRKLKIGNAQFDAERAPVLAEQHDQAFQSQQAVRQQQRALQAQQAHLNRLRAEAAQMGLDAKKLEQQRQETGIALGRGYAMFDSTGDPDYIKDAWNATSKDTGMAPIEVLAKNKNGSFTLKMADTDKPLTIQDSDHLMSTISTVLNPANYVKIRMASAQAQQAARAARMKNPKNFRELLRDNAGNLVQYDYETGQTSPVRNQKGGVVSGTLAGRSRGDTPEKIATQFYQKLLESGYSDEDAKNSTAKFMQTTHPETRGWWNPGTAAPQQPAQPSNWQTQGQQPAAPQSHGRVVRTGTAPDGTRVAQYEDGTVAPIQ